MKETRLKVPDMSCGHCVAAVQHALEIVEGVEEVDVSLDTKIVNIRAVNDLSPLDLMDVIRGAGYSPEAEW